MLLFYPHIDKAFDISITILNLILGILTLRNKMDEPKMKKKKYSNLERIGNLGIKRCSKGSVCRTKIIRKKRSTTFLLKWSATHELSVKLEYLELNRVINWNN